MLQKYYPPFLLNAALVLLVFVLMAQSEGWGSVLALLAVLALGSLLNAGLGLYFLFVRKERAMGSLYVGILAVVVGLVLLITHSMQGRMVPG